MSGELRVVYFKEERKPEGLMIENSYEAMKNLVGNIMDVVSLPMGIDLWVDDEGLLNDSRHTLDIHTSNGQVIPIMGNCFMASHNDEGDTVSLNYEQIEWIQSHVYMGFNQDGMIASVIKCD